MNTFQNLEQRIKEKLVEHQDRVHNHKNLEQQMVQVDQRFQRYTVLADRLTAELIRPQLARLANFFANSEVLPAEQVGRHQGVCVFKHTERFPATARLQLGLSRDGQAKELMLLCQVHIMPVFFDFPKEDQLCVPLEAVADDKVATWFEEKIVEFLDAYLRLETHPNYQADNIVTDPVCGMSINKLHATVRMEYRGVNYYFCVQDCQKKFAEDPDLYLAANRNSK